MKRTGLTGYYLVQAQKGGTNTYFRTTTQKRGVRSAVERSIVEYMADTVFVSYIAADQITTTSVAQVTSGGFWKWQQDPTDLRSFIEQEA